MKIFYMNDTAKVQQIYIDTFYNPGILIDPGKGDYFEINVKENQIPFIKTWTNGSVLLSGMDYEKDKK